LVYLRFFNSIILIVISIFIHYSTDENDIIKLQAALDSLSNWAATWQLTVSVEKCFALNIGNVVVQPRISINGISLPTVLSCRDLGITVSHDLSPSAHISGITVKAHQRANLIFRSLVSRDASLLLRAYLTYVLIV